jgi:glycosyltransferase involved in cell wall biosynthesis
MTPLLSVIIPVYNEAQTVREIIEKVSAQDIDKEIVVVDNGSTDGSDKILSEIKFTNLKVIHHATNRGKGAAFLTGLSHAQGEFVIIQDADLEYDPADYPKLLVPMRSGAADFVLGARFMQGYHGLLLHCLGNRFLTGLFNLLFRVQLNDYFSCYKLIRRDVLESLNLRAQGFDIDTEIVAKMVKKKMRIIEIPISYYPRSYSQGKKIRLKDGIMAVLAILRYRFS